MLAIMPTEVDGFANPLGEGPGMSFQQNHLSLDPRPVRLVFRWGYCDAKAFERFVAIFTVIRRAAPDSLGGNRFSFLVGCTLMLKRCLP